MTAANPSDILRTVERWARARGFVMHSRTGYNAYNSKGWGIHVNPLPPNGSLLIVPPGVNELMGVEVSPAIALAWASLVESEAAPVDVGRCPACVGRGGTADCQQSAEMLENLGCRDGWHVSDCFDTECPACTGTGRETIPAERLLLDAVSGDTTARDRLLVHADQLLESADPLGMLLAWALYLWTGEPTDCGECPECEGAGQRTWRVNYQPESPLRNTRTEPCETCSGFGRSLGHPHTAEAVAWLERLTWAREFAAERLRYWGPSSDEEWTEWGAETRRRRRGASS